MTTYVARVASNGNRPVTSRSLLVTPLLFLALAAPVHAEQPLFSSPFLFFDTGHLARSVAIADLNADGRPDLVTANIGYNTPDGTADYTVSVLLGSGDGAFGAETDYDVGSGIGCNTYREICFAAPLSVAIADLNGDGRLDLAVGNATSQKVSVFLGNGDGTFRPKTDFDTGYGPYSVAIADLNADGHPDLAVANFSGSSVSVLLGNGDGTFGPKTDFVTGPNPSSVAIADVNADGRPDLVVTDYGPVGHGTLVEVQLGNGDGTFVATGYFAAGTGPVSVAIADLNADGYLDLAVASGDLGGYDGHDFSVYPRPPNSVSILLGNGDGTFVLTTVFQPGGGLSVAIADLNSDGRPDLALANSGSVQVLPGNGDGTFGSGTNFAVGGANFVAIGDLNMDGRLDVAAAGRGVSVLEGNGDGTFGPKTVFGTGNIPNSVAIADLNADGRPDLAVADWGYGNGNAVSVLLGNGDGMFGPKIDFGTGVGPMSVAIADFNSDGRPDLATANWNYTCCLGTNTVSVLLGNGDGTFGSKTDFGIGGGPSSVAIADLNADGRPDLVAANGYTNTVSVLLGNGNGRFRPKTDFVAGAGVRSVAIADLNADGRPDLVAANGYTDSVSVLLGSGNGTFGPKTDFGTGPGPFSVAIGDLNADGRPDMAVANLSGNTVSVLQGNGDGTFGPKIDFGVGSNPISVAIADLNADRLPDLAVTNRGSNTVTVLLHTGAVTCPSIVMSFDLNPNTLNLQSMGHWITGTLEPEPPASPSDIDIASIRLNGSVPVDASAESSIGDVDHDRRPDLTVKFSRAAVELAVSEGASVPVTVTGKIGNGCFSATDVIRVVRGHVTAPAAGVALQGGGTAEVRWDTPAGIQVQSVAVLFSSDDGATWNLVANDLPNTGSYPWTVPGTAADQARIAVVLVESADPSGYEVTGVLGMSGRFAITSPLAVGASVGLSLSGSVPNPSRHLSVSFTLPDAKPARLVVYDVSGREVNRIAVGALGAGRHTVMLGASGTVAPGIYLVHLIRGDRRLVARMAVVR